MKSHVCASEVWGTEAAGLGCVGDLLVDDAVVAAVTVVEVTLAGVEPTKVLHLVKRRRRRGREELVPLAEGFVPLSPTDPRVRVLGAVLGAGKAKG